MLLHWNITVTIIFHNDDLSLSLTWLFTNIFSVLNCFILIAEINQSLLKISFITTCYIQGPRTQIDAFQTNIFSWLNDIVIKTQWFLGSWGREIWYKILSFCFINLTWPPWPQKEKVQKLLWDVGVALPW